MKIAVIVNSYPPRLGGLEFHVENLAQGLKNLGHEVWVYTISDHPHERCDDGVKVTTWRSFFPIADVISFPPLGTRKRLTQLLKRDGIDVVSIHTRFFPMSFIGLRAAHAASIPCIHTEHGSGFVAASSMIVKIGSRTVDLTMGRYILRHADKVLAISDNASRFVHRLAHVDSTVFYNAINLIPRSSGHNSNGTLSLHRSDHASASLSQRYPNRPNHLVFVGRLVPGKGWDTFLECVQILHQAGYKVSADILGDGTDYNRAIEYRHALNLDDVVQIHGRVDQSEVRDHLADSTLVNPTILSEGFQTTLLESIAVGGQIATFDVPGATLLKESGAPVTICQSHSASDLARLIAKMSEHPMPCASEALVAQWTWPARVTEYENIARQVIQ
ncbi:glycosyltransferase family 4 protein [Actinomyces vulturis]|uniref:glycosyltransferase family 4 protein n=1 Tax=Actinomyces vulturis TaxID=1857645 RepID=UPI000834BB26|nr:glycosyltransferase family 4 protein [Actinomyces vulturis]